VGGAGIGFKPKLIDTSTDLEPENPTLNPPCDSIDHISTQPNDLGLKLYIKPMIKKYKKLQPQKMSLYRNIGWFLNKKRGRNDLFLIYAPSLVGSCNHKAMIELARIRKLKD
jgi:hypothetical protein